MTSQRDGLVGILDELGDEDFERFKFYLQDRHPVLKSGLENGNRLKTVDEMVEMDSCNAVEVAKAVLEKMGQNELVKELSDMTCDPAALRYSPSNLRQLQLSHTHPGASGVSTQPAEKDPQCRPKTPRGDHGGEQRLNPDVRKWFCHLELDANTANGELILSDNNRKVTRVEEEQEYPDHPHRFNYWPQLLCRNGLTGRCYWEVEWLGGLYISVCYGAIRRKGDHYDCAFGWNNQSWCLSCSDYGYSFYHNSRRTPISSPSVSKRVGVYVDCPAGTLSFYRVSSDTLIHLHTENTTFTQPLYPGFWLLTSNSSASLCSV